MTCKNCYHYEVCSKKDGTTDYYGKEIACGNADKLCEYFKDKSRIIELPKIEIGQELSAIDNNVVQGTKLLASHAGRTLDTITREEAEARLKELNEVKE